jgi:hypothetical protein
VPYVPPSPYQQFCPPALTDAAAPLDGVRRLLRAVSDDHTGLADLAGAGPAVHAALDRFLSAYAGTAYALSVTASDLSYNLRLAAESYRGTEQALYDAAMGRSPRTRS